MNNRKSFRPGHRIDRRTFLRAMSSATAVGVAAPLVGCATDSADGLRITKEPPAQLTDLNMLCWTDNALDEYVEPFESEFGVRINRTYFDGNANAFNRLRLGGVDTFDIVQSDGLWPERYAEEGLIVPIEPEEFPDAYPTLWDVFKMPGYQMFEGRWYAFPNAWDAVGVGYNTEEVSPYPEGFDILWDPAYQGRVAFPLVEDNSIQIAALYLGYDNIYCLSDEQLVEVEAALFRLRENAGRMYTDLTEIEQLFGRGEATVGLVAISWVILKLKQAGLPFELVVPSTTQGWVDNYMVSSGSTRQEMAKFFINWYASPESQLNFLRIGSKKTCQAGVREFLTPEEIVFYGMEDPTEVVNGLLQYEPACNPDAYAEVLARLRA